MFLLCIIQQTAHNASIFPFLPVRAPKPPESDSAPAV